MNLRRKVKRNNFFREYVRVLNGILDLSPREMDVFSLFLRIDYEWRPVLDTDIKNVLSTDNRKKVMRESHVNKNNLTKYVSILKDKGLIVELPDKGWEVASQLLPNLMGSKEIVSFILEIENNVSKKKY